MQKEKTPGTDAKSEGAKKGVVKQYRGAHAQPDDGERSKNDRLKQSKNGRIKKARRKERFIMGSAAVLLLALAMMCLLLLFKVQDVKVVDSAQQRYTDAEVIVASGIGTGDSMLWLKEEAAAEKLTAALPYIAEAQVRKKYPSRVEITVTYARPAMAIKADAGYIVLSADGKVLQTGATALSDYVAELVGAEVAEAVPGKTVVFKDETLLEQVTALAGAFADAGFLNVTAYDVSDLQNVTVEVEYKVDVKLGNASKVEGKLAFGKEVIERSLADAKHSSSKIVVDLTTENTAYVRSQADIDAAATMRQAAADAKAPDAAADGEDDAYDGDEDDENYDDYDDEDEDYDDEDSDEDE